MPGEKPVPPVRPVLLLVIASTRPGRIGLPVAQWFQRLAVAQGDFEVRVADLAEIQLPFLDEPHHPRLRRYTHQHTKDWSAVVEAADAFVFVMPEYNYGFNAPLKNALDYLFQEWQYKPAGFVSYGGVAAGTRALQMVKQVVTALKMMPVDAVSLPFVSRLLDAEGHLRPDEPTEAAAGAMLAELRRWSGALRPLRG